MRLKDLKENDKQLDEFLPAVGAAVGGIARGAAAVGSTALKGAQALGGAAVKGAQALGSAAVKGAQAAGQAGLAGGQMDPAQAAQAAKDQQEQKKQIQDQIKQTQAQ